MARAGGAGEELAQRPQVPLPVHERRPIALARRRDDEADDHPEPPRAAIHRGGRGSRRRPWWFRRSGRRRPPAGAPAGWCGARPRTRTRTGPGRGHRRSASRPSTRDRRSRPAAPRGCRRPRRTRPGRSAARRRRCRFVQCARCREGNGSISPWRCGPAGRNGTRRTGKDAAQSNERAWRWGGKPSNSCRRPARVGTHGHRTCRRARVEEPPLGQPWAGISSPPADEMAVLPGRTNPLVAGLERRRSGYVNLCQPRSSWLRLRMFRERGAKYWSKWPMRSGMCMIIFAGSQPSSECMR